MGSVYLARDDAGRTAVVKTIRSDLAADSTYRARFRSEAQAALRFRSNLVARVWDCDAGADPPWIALEKIDGPTLAELVADDRVMDAVTLSAFAADLAEGVHAFYDQGMAHGDLTPTNVVLQDGTRVKILDLGLARPTADETATNDLPAMGTPYWLAPEVAAGFAPDSLSDVNQWAKLVLFAGTGYPRSGPKNLRHALAELSPPLRAIVERCVSAIPDARLQPDELWNQTRRRRLSGSAPPALTFSRQRLSIRPGGTASLTASAGNRSATSERFRFDLLGPLAQWASIDPPGVSIPAGGETDVQVAFDIPMGSPVFPGDWPFGVRCTAEVDESRSAVAEGTIAVGAVSHFRVELQAQAARGRWTGRYVVRVRNDGNAAARVHVTTPDRRDDLSFAVSPPLLQVPPGEDAVCLVKVRVRRPSLLGKSVEHPFLISLAEDAGQPAGETGPVAVRASFCQVSVFPRTVTVILVVAVVSAALIFLVR
jgi:hypothetical protein